MKYHSQQLSFLQEYFKTSFANGLTTDDALKKLKIYGYNDISTKKIPTFFSLLWSQIKNPFMSILLVAGFFAWIHGNIVDALGIVAITIFNSILGAFQERNAQAILTSLSSKLEGNCRVIRDGVIKEIAMRNLVPGDIVIVGAGERIPADMRIIHEQGLEVNESLVTGESAPRAKHAEDLKQTVHLFEQDNMLFAGTHVVHGTARACVVATGVHTEIGKLQQISTKSERPLPLRVDVERLVKYLLRFVFVVSLIVFIIGSARGIAFFDMALFASVLFVCMIPEGLPVVVTVVLAFGARRMAQRNVLVRTLNAVEGLSRVDVLVVDKTGTLTRNEMMVTRVMTASCVYEVTGSGYVQEGQVKVLSEDEHCFDEEDFLLIRDACFLLDTSYVEQNSQGVHINGDETEAALGIFARKVSVQQQRLNHYTKVYDLPFGSEWRMRVGAFLYEGSVRVFFLGAPEAISHITTSFSHESEAILAHLFAQGLRVITCAYWSNHVERLPETEHEWQEFIKKTVQGKATLLGFLGMQDPIRPEVKHMVHEARVSGIEIIMATGDHPITARAIAQETGILLPGDTLVTGDELRVQGYHDSVTVCARVTPEDKLFLVQALHAHAKRVAMTGDGVNDVPSLVAADVGIAMGIGGTDSARDVADLVLMDNSFLSIIYAVEEGRFVLSTLRRVVLYLLTTNAAELMFVVATLIAGYPLPLMAIHVVWFNFVTHGFFDLALAQEQREQGLLAADWLQRARTGGIVDSEVIIKVCALGFPAALMAYIFFLMYSNNLALARTMAVIVLAVMQWTNAWNSRSEYRSLFTHQKSNLWLIGATIVVFILQLLLMYIPFFASIFYFVPLTFVQWMLCVPCIVIQLIAGEFVKALSRRV